MIKIKISCITVFIAMQLTQLAYASNFPSVDKDIKFYDDQVTEMNISFNKIPPNPNNKVWVKLKLQHMVDVDQYTRKYLDTPYNHKYSDAEKAEFNTQFNKRWLEIDSYLTVLPLHSMIQQNEICRDIVLKGHALDQEAGNHFQLKNQFISMREEHL